MNIKTDGHLSGEDYKDIQISKLENQVKDMEEELNSMQVIIQNHAFEKRQLMQQIDKLEERLEKEKVAKRATLTHEAKKRLSLAVDPGDINLLAYEPKSSLVTPFDSQYSSSSEEEQAATGQTKAA